jgi:hypothetical protein
MDCPSEERIICLALQGLDSVKGLRFDLTGRQLAVSMTERLDRSPIVCSPLGMGAVLKAATSDESRVRT